MGRCDRRCGGEPGRSALGGRPRGLPISACSRSCASRPIPTPPCAIGRCCGSWQDARPSAAGTPPISARVETLLDRLRARHGLFTRAALDRWLETNGIEARQLERLLEDEARLESINALATPSLRDALLDELRLRDEFARLAARAHDKQAALDAHGMDHPTADCGPAAPPRLRAWYFEQRLGRPLPDDIDAAARELGFVDRADLDRALRREWLYSHQRDAGAKQ